MKDFDAIFKHVKPDVPTCPYPVLVSKIRDAAIDFCKRTLILHEDVKLVTAADELVYSVALEGHTVQKLEAVSLSGSDVWVPNRAELRDEAQIPRNRQYARLVGDDVVLSQPTIDAGRDLVVSVVRVPSDDCTQLDDILVDLHARDIAAGALELLHGMRKQDWTDQVAEARAAARFNKRVSTVAIQVERGKSSAPQRVKAHFF